MFAMDLLKMNEMVEVDNLEFKSQVIWAIDYV